jgi:hypothetical protein
MKHAGAGNVIERLTEFGSAFNGKLAQFEIVESVLFLQFIFAREAVGADIDADDARVRPPHGIVRGLYGSAAGDEDRAICAILLAGPQETRFGPPPFVVPYAFVRIEIVDRRRIGMCVVERA